MPAFLSAGVRFVLAAALLAALSHLRGGRAAWHLGAAQWRNAAICGVLMLAGGNGLVVVAETRVPSGLAALLIAAVPLWLIVLRRVLGDRTPALTLVGVLVGLGGLALLLLPGSAGSHVDLGYSLLLVVAALSWAAGSVLVTRVQLPDDPAVLSSVEMFAGGVVLLVAAAGGGEFGRLDFAAISVRSWLSLAYLVVFGSLVASVVVVVSAEGRKRRAAVPPPVVVDERAAA